MAERRAAEAMGVEAVEALAAVKEMAEEEDVIEPRSQRAHHR